MPKSQPRGSVAFLRKAEDALDLTPEQAELWQSLDDAFREIADTLKAFSAISDPETGSRAPTFADVLAKQILRLALQNSATQRVASGTRRLYAELSPRQRTMADRYLTTAWQTMITDCDDRLCLRR